MSHATSRNRWMLFGMAALFIMVGMALDRPLMAAGPSLQDMIGEKPSTARVTPITAATAEFNEVGFKIGGEMYKNDFNDERWRTECFSYQGMGHLDAKFLDFVYGGDDVIVFCFNGPAVKNGGKLAITALIAADPGDVEISTSSTNKDFKRVATISRLGKLEADLPPSDGAELYLMLDGRRGNGVVVDDLSVSFGAQPPAPSPTPTPTPKPAVQDDRPGYQQPVRGTSRGERVEPAQNPDGVKRDTETRTGVTKPQR